MKTTNNKAKTILLSSLSVLSVASAVALVTVSNISSNQKILSTKNLISSSKSISSNTNGANNLINPNELFYATEKLDDSVDVWDSTNNNKNDSNFQKWSSFENNLNNLTPSTNPTLVELKRIAKQAKGVADLKTAYKTLDELKDQNSWITDEMISSMKQDLKNQSGYEENMKDISGIDSIPEKLLTMSGISDGTKISSINNYDNFKLTNLSNSTSGGTNKNTIRNISSVAGQDYTQLVKIAEIDPNQAGNYALSFKYKKTNSSATVSGTLYIKNTNESSGTKLSSNINNLSQLKDSFDVFGRWSLGLNGTIGSSSYDKEMENFIIQKGTNESGQEVVEILVRLKNGQTITDIQWGNDTLLPGATDLKTGSRFGILDVQADENNTFKSAILGNWKNGVDNGTTTIDDESNNQYPSNGKLISDINDTNIINKIRFFSDNLTSKVKNSSGTNNDDSVSSKANRTLEFYQYENVDLNLPLYYAVNSDSDVSESVFTYKPLYIYTNGVASSNQQTLQLNSTSSIATTLSPASYSMFSDLKEELPQEVQENFIDSSKIQLSSSIDTSKKTTKQVLTFFDNFYAIGNRDEGWTSISTNGDIKLIKISDPTLKVFAEDPNEGANYTSEIKSTTQAQETLNERTVVIGFLGNVYDEFSKSNSGVLNGEKYSLSFGRWNAKGPNGSNIIYENQNVNGSANDVYNVLNSTWSNLSPVMDKLFSLSSNAERYKVGSTTASSIVNSYLAFTSEFTSNANELESIISDAISTVKSSLGEGTSITEQTTYENLTNETKKSLGKLMSRLIQIQLGTIANEFNLRLSTPIYDAIKSVLEDQNNKVSFSINSPATFLETVNNSSSNGMNLIKYSIDGWNKIVNSTEVSLKDGTKSLFALLYFGNGNVYLGDSIFNSGSLSAVFKAMNAESLITFEADSFIAKNDKVAIYNKLFATFTNLNLESKIQEMLRIGTPASINSNEIKSNILEALLKLSNQIERVEAIQDATVTSYYLDDLISGTNAIISLNWKLQEINGNVRLTSNNNNEIRNNILSILNSNEQMSSSELSIWSNIIDNTKDYSEYTKKFSGRDGSDVSAIADKLIEDSSLLASRSLDITPAIVVLEFIIKYAWWIVIALVGVGILTSSSIAVATKDRKVRLSSRPVLKWLLISGIVLGIAVTAIAILLGIPTFL